jgi:hypothetical protein
MSGLGRLGLGLRNFGRRGSSIGGSPAVNTVAPSISGTRGGTLTATPGTWTGATSVSGQWYVNGTATGNFTTSYNDASTSTSAIEYRETAMPGSVTASVFLSAVTSFLGLNLIDFSRTNQYGDVPLTDLFQGDRFTYLAPGPVNTPVPAANLDANGWVTSVPADSIDGRIYYVIRYPLNTGDCAMTWTGAFDSLSVGGANFSISAITANSATLTFTATIPNGLNNAQISFIPNAANPPKNIQIIPNGRTGTFTPEFKTKLASFVGQGPIRFIKWTPQVESGTSVTTRNTTSSVWNAGNDGVPMEIMLQLLSEVGMDGFFNFGVLESDTVINQKLALIDAWLAANPARKAHIQSSNEDWNTIYGQVQYVLQGWASADGLDNPTAGVAISSITRSGTTATVTTSTAHGRSTNDWVKVSGATPAGFNGSYRITVTSTTTFTYTMAADPGSNATAVGSYTYGADIFGGMYRESAKRSNHVMDLVAAAIDPTRMSRVVRELGTQNANPSVTDALLAYTGTAAHHDRILVGAYWGNKYDVFPKDGTTRAAPNNVQYTTADFPAILTDLKLGIDAVFDLSAQHQAKAAAAGLGFGGYEFGIERAFTDLTVATSWYESQQAHDATMYACQEWERRFGATAYANWFVETGAVANENNTGRSLQRYLGDTLGVGSGKSAKGQAVVDYNTGNRQPNDLTGTLSCSAGDPNGTVVGTLSKFVVGSTLSIQSGGSGLTINSSTGAVTVANSASLPAAGTYSVVIRETNSGFPTPGYHDTTISWAVIASAALADNFDDNSRDATKWNVAAWAGGDATGVTVAEQNGELEVTGPVSTAGVHFSGYVSVNAVNVTGRAAQVQIKSTGTVHEFYLSFGPDASNNYLVFVDTGTLFLAKIKAGAQTLLATVGAWSATTHQWWRLRHGGAGDDTIYFDTAPSTAANPPASGDWVNRASAARDAAIALTSAHYAIGGGTYGSTPSPTTFKFDNFSAG